MLGVRENLVFEESTVAIGLKTDESLEGVEGLLGGGSSGLFETFEGETLQDLFALRTVDPGPSLAHHVGRVFEAAATTEHLYTCKGNFVYSIRQKKRTFLGDLLHVRDE